MSKKPRKNKLDPKKVSLIPESQKRQEKDWTFEDILRSKRRGR